MKYKESDGYLWPMDVRDSAMPFSLRRVKSMKWVIKHCKSKKLVIQAGGSYGVWPRTLAKYFEIVYSFEPEPTSFYFLCRNCPELNIVKLEIALGDVPMLISMNRNGDTSHTVNKSGNIIPMMTIDSFKLPFCDAILLDVEGYEYKALIGARETIFKYKPIVLIEDRYSTEPIPAVKFLLDSGYREVEYIQGDRIFIHEKA